MSDITEQSLIDESSNEELLEQYRDAAVELRKARNGMCPNGWPDFVMRGHLETLEENILERMTKGRP